MENIKEKIPMILAGVIAIAICVMVFNFLENYEAAYYTQIDNTKIQKVATTDNMKYEYTLDCYSKEGKKKEMKFRTSRELKEKSYLMLEVRTFGVYKWKEVQYNDLPNEVKANYVE